MENYLLCHDRFKSCIIEQKQLLTLSLPLCLNCRFVVSDFPLFTPSITYTNAQQDANLKLF